MHEDKDVLHEAVLTENVKKILNPEEKDWIWFGLKKGDIEFTMGLSEILACLKFAERVNEIPPLPQDWWHMIEGIYPSDGNFEIEME